MNSINTITKQTVAAIESDIGPENIIPSIPKTNGNTTRRGIRNITCLVKDKNTPLTGFPIAEKKLEEIICTPVNVIINKKVFRLG